MDRINYEISLDGLEDLIDTYDIENKGKITFDLFKYIMKEDILLQGKQKAGIGTILTKGLVKKLSSKELDFYKKSTSESLKS